MRDGFDILFSPSSKRSKQLVELINKMMHPVAEQRISVEELQLHPLVQKAFNSNRASAQTFCKDLER
jgi:hypothetical protein